MLAAFWCSFYFMNYYRAEFGLWSVCVCAWRRKVTASTKFHIHFRNKLQHFFFWSTDTWSHNNNLKCKDKRMSVRVCIQCSWTLLPNIQCDVMWSKWLFFLFWTFRFVFYAVVWLQQMCESKKEKRINLNENGTTHGYKCRNGFRVSILTLTK